MSVLMNACNQWMSRPADQRFSSLEELHGAVQHYRDIAAEATNVDVKSLRVAVGQTDTDGHLIVGGETPGFSQEPVVIGPSGIPAQFTHYSFGQFARRLSAPAHYLRELPVPLAVANLNHGLAVTEKGDDDNMLFTQNGGLVLRSIVSDKYTRIWNSDITSRLIRLTEQSPEWQPAPAAFDGSRGLYASDRDVFAFLVDNDRRIFEKGPGGGLGRGFFVSNSEVGDKSFSVTSFFYEYVCGNHRVWGASGVQEIRIPHIGDADDRAFAKLSVELRKYADSSAAEDEAKVASMRKFELGATKEEVLDKVFGLRINGLGKKLIEAAYDKAEERVDRYGSPRTVWGFNGGLTELATNKANADERVALEKAAGKVAQIAF